MQHARSDSNDVRARKTPGESLRFVGRSPKVVNGERGRDAAYGDQIGARNLGDEDDEESEKGQQGQDRRHPVHLAYSRNAINRPCVRKASGPFEAVARRRGEIRRVARPSATLSMTSEAAG